MSKKYDGLDKRNKGAWVAHHGLEIELTDGTRLSERVSAVRGTPRNPMSRDEVIKKGARPHRSRAGARNSGTFDRNGIFNRNRNGHSQFAATPAARL